MKTPVKKRFKWSDDLDIKLLEMASQHKTATEIGLALGADTRSIYDRVANLKKKGHTVLLTRKGDLHPNVTYSSEIVTEAKEMFKIGRTIEQISKKLSIDPNRIRDWISGASRKDG